MTYSHDVSFVGCPQLGADFRFCPAHIVDRVAPDGDDPLLVEGCDLVDGRHCDLGVSVLHDSLNCGALQEQRFRISMQRNVEIIVVIDHYGIPNSSKNDV